VNTDPEVDLRWYFTDAAAECGVRSAMGPQLERLSAYACTSTDTGGICITGRVNVRSSRAVARPCDAEMQERRLDAARRANAIAARLRQLTPRQQTVLEMQFAYDVQLTGNVSLALACVQPAAIAGHMATRISMNNQRARGRPSKKDGNAATIRLWLAWIHDRAKAGEDGASKLYTSILKTARRELDDARRAYELTEMVA